MGRNFLEDIIDWFWSHLFSAWRLWYYHLLLLSVNFLSKKIRKAIIIYLYLTKSHVVNNRFCWPTLGDICIYGPVIQLIARYLFSYLYEYLSLRDVRKFAEVNIAGEEHRFEPMSVSFQNSFFSHNFRLPSSKDCGRNQWDCVCGNIFMLQVLLSWKVLLLFR